ncbi:MAG: hypothetical protein R3E91_05310 [Chlamydiales bacterium]
MISVIAGAYRIKQGWQILSLNRKIGYLAVIRGVIEIVGLGILFLIPDLIASVKIHLIDRIKND